jgi:uncharacterized protein (TIGR02246 family)
MATRPTTPISTSDTRSEVRKLEKTFESAFNSNDLQTLVGLYTPDATFLPPNHAPCEGSEGIKAFFREMKEAGASELHLEQGRIEQSGDLVVHRGRYICNVPAPSGGTRPDRGNFLVVYRRENNGLRTLFDTYNSELPL